MEEVWSAVHNAGHKPTASESEMSTAPWRRVVCVSSYADDRANLAF